MEIVKFDPDDAKLVQSILAVSAFRPLAGGRLSDVMQTVSICDYERRETIIEQGETDKRMFFLMDGALSVRVDGTEISTMDAPGTVFGEMGIIEDSPRSASVVAKRDCRCLVMDVSIFMHLEGRSKLAVQAFFYKMFCEVLSKRLREANERITDLDLQKAVLENMKI